MGDARAKAVQEQLVDTVSRSNYVVNNVTSLREPLGNGDIIEIPELGDLTVEDSGDTGGTAQAATPTVNTLTANLDPAIFVKLPKVDQKQLLNGTWPEQTAMHALKKLMNKIDNDLVREYLIKDVAWDADGTYHVNIGAADSTGDHYLEAISKIAEIDGVDESDIAIFVHPFGRASIMSIDGFMPNFTDAQDGKLGIRSLGELYGVQCFTSNSMPRRRTVAVTSSSISSNVATLTVAAGHGIVVGDKLTTTGMTANQSTATACTAVTTTTITLAITGSDGSNGTGTIYVEATQNLVMDRSKVWAALQTLPEVEVAKYTGKTGHELQVSSLWGRKAKAGYVYVVNSPGSGVVN